MAAIFNSSNDVQIVKAYEATIEIDGHTVIATDVTIQFQRPVENVPVIGKTNVISVGRPQGTLTANAIMCSKDETLEAMHLNQDDCTPFTMLVTLKGTCDTGSGTLSCAGCVASAVNVQMQGGRGYIVRGATVTFTQLNM